MTKQEQGGDTAPRSITPHKGGRTERVYVRATPEVEQKAREIKRLTGKSAADLFEEYIIDLYERKIKMSQAITPITHRVIMEFGAGLLRNETEIFSGTEEECRQYFDDLPTADEIGPDAYERTHPFVERSRIEEIEDDNDPRWP